MLNNPDEDATTSPETESADPGAGSHILQLIVIAFVGIYLFSVVWMYAQLPWLAIAVTAIAVSIMAFGFIRRIRD